MTEQHPVSSSSTENRTPAIAMILLALALLVQMGSAAFYAHRDKQTLQTAIANQEAAISETRKVRQQLNTITGKTVQLAQQGNVNAARIIEKMRAAGVNLSGSEQ